MDIKGTTWVETMYHKFEAMCVEMEEVMHQDTAKYMENQVQKVGICVKKFYSEVMDDVRPPPCIAPMQKSLGDSLNCYDRTNVSKKPVLRICDSRSSPKKKLNEDRVIVDAIAEKESSSRPCSVSSLSALSPGSSKHNDCHELCSDKSKKLGAYRRKIGIKRLSQDSHPSNDSTQSTFFSALANTNVIPSSKLDGIYGEAVKENKPLADKSVEPSDSNMNSSAEVLRQTNNDSMCLAPVGNNFPSEPSTFGSNIQNNACNIEGISMEQGFPNTNSDTCDIEFRAKDKDRSISDKEKIDAELIENEEATGSSVDIIEHSEDANLDKSCVVVEGFGLPCDPQGTSEMSYKKKICRALSSKLRLRKHDHFVSMEKDSEDRKKSAGMSIPSLVDDEKRISCQLDDWELL